MCNFNTKLANTISRKNVFIAFFCCLSTIEIYAQTADGSEKTFCDPSIPGQPRPKFLEITRGTSTSFSVENISQFEGIEDGNAQAASNSTLEIKLNAPVLLKPGFKIIAGLKYFKEDFEFTHVASPTDLYFQNLHDKSLRSIRGSLYGIKSFKGNTYLATRFSASLNGDMKNNFTDTEKQYVNFSAAAILGWKKNATFVYGFGLAYTNMFGVNRIYPVVALEKSFNQHWGFEALLPKTASLRYVTTDKKNNFYGMMSLDGGTYRINIQELIPNQDLVLQRNEIQGKLVYEREIYDWIWLGVEAGVRKSINGDLTFPGDRKTIVYETQFGTNAFVNFSLFLVPPRKLLERF